MEFIKPGPNKRVCAFLIDSIIGQILGILVSSSLKFNLNWPVWAAYILLKDSVEARSIGKFFVGIQVTDENNNPAKAPQTILRNLLMIIPIFPLVEYFVLLRNAQGRRLGDKAAKTQVTDLKPQLKDATFLWISILLLAIFVIVELAISYAIIKQHPELLKNA
ncbi:MAG: RDD family protein [Candidatus Omnitrophica bacterium]|nr:RDD family protein [Candidatus Omnitrophota bacterium]